MYKSEKHEVQLSVKICMETVSSDCKRPNSTLEPWVSFTDPLRPVSLPTKLGTHLRDA